MACAYLDTSRNVRPLDMAPDLVLGGLGDRRTGERPNSTAAPVAGPDATLRHWGATHIPAILEVEANVAAVSDHLSVAEGAPAKRPRKKRPPLSAEEAVRLYTRRAVAAEPFRDALTDVDVAQWIGPPRRLPELGRHGRRAGEVPHALVWRI